MLFYTLDTRKEKQLCGIINSTTLLPLFYVFKNTAYDCNKQHHRKVLLNNFQLNGHTLGFHPQTQKLEPPCTA